MPITKITIQNFKGIKDRVEIPIRPITLLFGANSAGKSTMLQALLFLRELLEGRSADTDRLSTAGPSSDLGGFREFVHGRDVRNKIRIGVTLRLDADGIPDAGWQDGDQKDDLMSRELDAIREAGVELEVVWSPQDNRPYVTSYQVHLDGVLFASAEAAPGREAEIKKVNGEHPVFGPPNVEADGTEYPSDFYSMLDSTFSQCPPADEEDERSRQRIRLGAKVIPDLSLGLPIAWANPLDDADAAKWTFDLLNRAMTGVGKAVLNQLQAIRYIGPIRRIPERNFQPLRSPGEDRWSDGSGAWDLICSSETNHSWLDPKAIRSLGLGLEVEQYRYFEVPVQSCLGVMIDVVRASPNDEDHGDRIEQGVVPSEIKGFRERSRLQLVSEANGLELQPCEVGVGVSQVLPVAIGAMAPGYSMLAVEQPELHIHPAIQCNLGDLLAAQVIGNQDRALLLETHSEHLLLRLLRRIRENSEDELPPGSPPLEAEHLSVLWVEQENGEVVIKEIPVTKDGDFSEQWPKGFFEERANELF